MRVGLSVRSIYCLHKWANGESSAQSAPKHAISEKNSEGEHGPLFRPIPYLEARVSPYP